MIQIPSFCEQWPTYARHTVDEQRRYVLAELSRLDRAGLPLLLTVLQQQNLELQQIAVDLLRTNGGDLADGMAEQPFRPRRTWRLRLVAGEKPHPRDPQGRELPEHLRGKVLVVKTGNLGGDVVGATEAALNMTYAAEAREQRARTGRPLYKLRQVTREGDDYTLDEAVTILSAWGVAVSPRQYRRPDWWRPGMSIDPSDPNSRGLCNWLVEEVPFEAIDPNAAGDDGFGGRRAPARDDGDGFGGTDLGPRAGAGSAAASAGRRNRNPQPPPTTDDGA